MANNDFFLDEEDDEELEDSGYFGDEDDEEEEDSDEDDVEIGEDIREEEKQKSRAEKEKDLYGGRLTADEIYLSAAYDTIQKAAKKNEKKENSSILDDVVTTLVMANPKHSSVATVASVTKEALQKQGHSRMVATLYTPETPLRGEDIDIDLNGDDDSGFNEKYAREAKDRIAAFVEYLSTRDLSKDSTVSRRRKQRQLPAFIIFLFTSGMYDLILNCPTMPPEYAKQIESALETIMKEKYSIVDELARRYESEDRKEIADRVRKMGLSWFLKEPNEIRTAYSDLDITQDDVDIYREYRSKYTNASKAITQELISDLIEVVVDPESMIYEKLKDKTRADAIADVKEVFKEWSKDNPTDSELATKVIWGDLDLQKQQY